MLIRNMSTVVMTFFFFWRLCGHFLLANVGIIDRLFLIDLDVVHLRLPTSLYSACNQTARQKYSRGGEEGQHKQRRWISRANWWCHPGRHCEISPGCWAVSQQKHKDKQSYNKLQYLSLHWTESELDQIWVMLTSESWGPDSHPDVRFNILTVRYKCTDY